MPRPAPPERIPVALLGATGAVGQRFASLLEFHPWFRLERLFASERSAQRPYGEACPWVLPTPMPADLVTKTVEAATPEALSRLAAEGFRVVFSALDAAVAEELERAAAAGGAHVFSNASSHRLDPSVPLVVPEVNAEHLALFGEQVWAHPAAKAAGQSGQIVTNPNCTAIGLCLALAPLARRFGLSRVGLVSLQALSGAGLVDGRPLALDDNVIPFIAGEEEKLAVETRKVLGTLGSGSPLRIVPAELFVSATCTRVPVTDGHTLVVSVELEQPARADELHAVWSAFRAHAQELELPSAPLQPVHVLSEPGAPQPKLHRDLEAGMAVSVGRLRPEALFGEAIPSGLKDSRDALPARRGWKFVTLSHNTLRGAAGGSLLNAELAWATGLLQR